MELSETHKRLLQRGKGGRAIGVSGDAGRATAELIALGELERAGLVKPADWAPTGGPPVRPSRFLTAIGLAAANETKG